MERPLAPVDHVVCGYVNAPNSPGRVSPLRDE